VVTAILVALLAIHGAPAQQRNDARTWYQAYDDAQRRIHQKNWPAAVLDIETALRRGAPRPGRRVHFYGNVYREFNPDYYLGVAYLNLGRYVDADRAFERVRQARLISPSDALYAAFMQQSTMAKRMLEQKTASQPPPPAPPASSAPPPAPLGRAGRASPPPRGGATAPPVSAPKPAPPAKQASMPRASSPAAGLPAFPWPPPRYSAYAIIAREWVALTALATLASAADRLEEAFDAAGYGERSYYWIPGGFALVSRIEQILPDAAPVGLPARWAVNTPTVSVGVIDYIRALFNAAPGFYRVIVFTVTDQDFAAAKRAPTSSEARNWISAGSLRLPETVGSLPYSNRHYTTALIYEFERRADQPEALMRAPSDSPGRVHLEKAGLWQALARR
jgi:hypothetical protein